MTAFGVVQANLERAKYAGAPISLSKKNGLGCEGVFLT